MCRVQFFAENLFDKTRTRTNELYFEEITGAVKSLIDIQRARLETELPYYRIICLIENVEST